MGNGTDKKPCQKSPKIKHVCSKNISLTEDVFGLYYDEYGLQKKIKRFTWKNHNDIQVQVITFGARVTSIKMPNNKGLVEDIVLGCSDLPGYLVYDKLYLGATIGRFTEHVENATFAIDGKQYWLSKNKDEHHYNGGFKGLDKALWSAHVDDTTVILSHAASAKEEGYPGNLLIRVYFKLSHKNEFHISMEAFTTDPTIINLSNLLFFNLGGHGSGKKELYKHIVSINSNCYINMREDGLPDGKVKNVMFSKNDFQIPKLLAKHMGLIPCDGFDQYLCVNRGVEQGDCFVARVLHPPSGRMLELYSNQPAVYFSTANHFPPSPYDIPVSSLSSSSSFSFNTKKAQIQTAIDLVNKLHEKMKETLNLDSQTDYSELRDLIRKVQARRVPSCTSTQCPSVPANTPTDYTETVLPSSLSMTDSDMVDILLNPLQYKYLEDMKELTENTRSKTDYSEVNKVLAKIIEQSTVKDPLEFPTEPSVEEVPLTDSEILQDLEKKKEEEIRAKEAKELERKGMIQLKNKIPSIYKDTDRIHGKFGAVYKRHAGMCLQTQNYPNAIYHENFPNCIIRPGEVYKHTITYKFWIRSEPPSYWNRRYLKEMKACREDRKKLRDEWIREQQEKARENEDVENEETEIEDIMKPKRKSVEIKM